MLYRDSAPQMSPIAAASRLKALPLFQGLEGGVLARLAAGASEVLAGAGSVIYRRGDASEKLYVVISGEVKLVLRAPNDAEKVVELVGPAGCFGGSSLFLERPYALTAVTIADSRLVSVTREAVLSELERAPAFARAINSTLSRRMQHLIGALQNCMVRSGSERVAGYLLDHIPRGAEGGEGLVVLPTQKGIIASQLNLTQAHFSRILHDLAEEGLIEVAGRSVRIRDVGRLRARCVET